MINLFVVLFILSCLFDPSNLIVGIKMPLFVVIMLYSLLKNYRSYKIDHRILKYILLFSFILPFNSILVGFFFNSGSFSFSQGMSLWKSYFFLLITFAIVNLKNKVDFVKLLSYCLVFLSLVILFLWFISFNSIIPFEILDEIGYSTGMFGCGERFYGPIKITRVYFHTSPMLVFAQLYFFDAYYKNRIKLNLLFSILISLALFASGTRNNMLMSIAPYIFYLTYNGNRKLKLISFLGVCLCLSLFIYSGAAEAMLDKDETSNSVKLGYLPCYLNSFSNFSTFLLGEGLGSYIYVPDYGPLYNTELSYFEMLRRFGIFSFLLYLFLMFYPIKVIMRYKVYIWLSLSYFMYLIMIFSNPFFFSSNGMLILSIVLSVIIFNKYQVKNA